MDAGYVDGGKFYALSDKAQVEFEIPRDYRKYSQTTVIVNALLDDIVESVYDEGDDFDAFYDSDWNYDGYTAAGLDGRIKPITIPATITEGDINPAVAGGTTNYTEGEVTARNAAIAVAEIALPLSRQHALTIYLNNLYN